MRERILKSDVAHLTPAERQAAEVFAGGPLENGQPVFFMVGRPPVAPSEEARADARRNLDELFRKIDERGVDADFDPDEADAAIDAAVAAERGRKS